MFVGFKINKSHPCSFLNSPLFGFLPSILTDVTLGGSRLDSYNSVFQIWLVLSVQCVSGAGQGSGLRSVNITIPQAWEAQSPHLPAVPRNLQSVAYPLPPTETTVDILRSTSAELRSLVLPLAASPASSPGITLSFKNWLKSQLFLGSFLPTP